MIDSYSYVVKSHKPYLNLTSDTVFGHRIFCPSLLIFWHTGQFWLLTLTGQSASVATGAALIGTAQSESPPLVVLKNTVGVSRILDMPSGEQLPRIC
jgi:hypothetical protein